MVCPDIRSVDLSEDKKCVRADASGLSLWIIADGFDGTCKPRTPSSNQSSEVVRII